MAIKPKIIVIFGFILILILMISSSDYTKKTLDSKRIDIITSNIFVNEYNNDFSYYQIPEPIFKIKNNYIDNNYKIIDNKNINQELILIPNPIVIEN